MVEVTKNQYVDYDWSLTPPGEWMEKAACSGRWEMFEITDLESDLRRDIEDKAKRAAVIKSHNNSKFKAALELCSSCPVGQECAEAITGEDAVWTIRDGRLPSIYRSRGHGRPRKDQTDVPLEARECVNGHVGKFRETNRGPRCAQCRNEQEYKGRTRPQIRYLPGVCSNGHVDKIRKRASTGYKYCAECNRVGRKESRDRANADKMGA